MKKKRILIIICILVIVSIIVFVSIYKKMAYKPIKGVKVSNTNIIEYGNIVYLSDYIKVSEGLLKDEKIIYSDLGQLTKDYIVNKDGKDIKKKISFNIVDKTPPVVLLKDSLTIEKNKDVNVAKSVFCADNFDAIPKCSIDGTFDPNVVGEYKLEYVAIDSSENKTIIPFTLKVIPPSDKPASSNNSSTSFAEVVNKHKNEHTKIGIDVSRWQGEINWQKVKNAGVEFAMIRMGVQNGFDADNFVDSQFINNIKGAQENDIEVGVYYYSYATTIEEAKEQAKWVIDVLKDYEISLPVVFDWESWSDFNNLGMSLFDITHIQETFLDILKEAGYRTSRYGSKNYLTNVWLESDHETWLAHYISKTTYEKDYYMWQLCNNGIVDGIKGYVDIDVMYLD